MRVKRLFECTPWRIMKVKPRWFRVPELVEGLQRDV